MTESIRLDGTSLAIADLVAVARGAQVSLAAEGLARMHASRAVIDRAVARRQPVYGVTTGLGARSTEVLDDGSLAAFSRQTLRGRAQATGPEDRAEVVRAGMLVRLNTLLTGLSGAAPAVAEHLAACLNAGLAPVAGRIGSIGPSDLVVNATVGLALAGEGRMRGPEGTGDAADMLRRAGIPPLALGPRDGLALASHSGASAGAAALALDTGLRAFRAAQSAVSLSLEGFRATLAPLDPRALAAKPLPGQQAAAADLRRRLEGSALWKAGAARRLQDPLSLRNVAQIHGAAQRALAQAEEVVTIEINGASDNPVVDAEAGEVLPTGAYYTAELALGCEAASRALLGLAMAQVARIAKLLDPRFSDLPPFLARPATDSNGFAPLMKTAEALVAEIAHAAQPPAIWPSLNAMGVEDTLSTGPVAARALGEVAEHVARLTALELIVAAQAVDMRECAGALGPAMADCHARVRALSRPLEEDRPLTDDLKRVMQAVLAEDFA